MTKTEKIMAYFMKHPSATPRAVATKFKASLPMVYKVRKQAHTELILPNPLDVPPLTSWQKIVAEVEKPVDVDETLDTRAMSYGKFKDGAALMQGIKRQMANHAQKHDKTFADDQWEALEMIVHKIGRIVNGNPDVVDHWVDIAGYAKLVSDRLQGVER
jgi:hypothetical protein